MLCKFNDTKKLMACPPFPLTLNGDDSDDPTDDERETWPYGTASECPSLSMRPHPELRRVARRGRGRLTTVVKQLAAIAALFAVGHYGDRALTKHFGCGDAEAGGSEGPNDPTEETLAQLFDRLGDSVAEQCRELARTELIGAARTDRINFDTMAPGNERSLFDPIPVGEEVLLYLAMAIPPGRAPHLETVWELNGKPSPAHTVRTAPKWGDFKECDTRLAFPITFTHPEPAQWTLTLKADGITLFRHTFNVKAP